MRGKLCKILVTGGAGFIGSEFVRQGVRRGYKVVVVDKLTYAGDLRRLEDIKGKYEFYRVDICDKIKIRGIFEKDPPQFVINFAAQTHVDRSIHSGSEPFIEANIKGVQVLLDILKKNTVEKFIHISTDEVYGEVKKGEFTEYSALNPGNPYSASKAAVDLFINAYIRTYDFPAVIVRPSNNYGYWQYPEKFIPLVILKALRNEKIPVYGRGLNIREWLYVGDCVGGIFKIMKEGAVGEIYNLGSGKEMRNIDTAIMILDILDKPKSLIEFVKDRPGHDYRYFLDSSKLIKLGWRAKMNFEKGIKFTVNWYKRNFDWVNSKVKFLEKYWSKVYKRD